MSGNLDGDIRSDRFLFLSHCLLAQAVRAKGLARYHPAAFKPVLQFCLENDINIVQMPCPEALHHAGGLDREPHGKKWYEDRGLRAQACEIAKGQAEYMKALLDQGYKVLAVVGLEFSPACAVQLLNKGPIVYREQGIFVEELKRHLIERHIDVPFMAVHPRGPKKLARDLKSLLAEVVTETVSVKPGTAIKTPTC